MSQLATLINQVYFSVRGVYEVSGWAVCVEYPSKVSLLCLGNKQDGVRREPYLSFVRPANVRAGGVGGE